MSQATSRHFDAVGLLLLAVVVGCANGDTVDPPGDAASVDADDSSDDDLVDYAPARIEEIASNETHVCARLVDGRTYCWGDLATNDCVTGADSSVATPTPISMLSHVGITKLSLHGPNCALHADGSVSCWGKFPRAWMGRDSKEDGGCLDRAAASIAEVTRLETGFRHACAIRLGEVWCWGNNEGFQSAPVWELGTSDISLPTRIAGISDATEIVASQPSCASSADGHVRCWGADPWRPDDAVRSPSPTVVAELTDVKRIGGTFTTGIALNAAGSVLEFHASMRGSVPPPSPLKMLEGSLDVYSVPWQLWHRLSGKTPPIVGGGSTIVVGVGADAAPRVYTREDPQFDVAAALADLRNARLIALAQTSVCVVIGDTEMRCAGWNDFGQLGDGTKTDSLTHLKLVRWPKGIR